MRAIAFTDDLLIAVEAPTVAEVKNLEKMEMAEIKYSPKPIYVSRSKKSNIMMVTRRRE